MGSTLRLGRAFSPPLRQVDTGVWRAWRWEVQHSRRRLIKSNNLPGWSNTKRRCWYPAKFIQQAPSHVPNPIPKDQCAGSVQDQVIRAPENCKAIPEQLLLSQEWSELSGLLNTTSVGAKGNSSGLHSFLSNIGGTVWPPKEFTSVYVWEGESDKEKRSLQRAGNHRPKSNL